MDGEEPPRRRIKGSIGARDKRNAFKRMSGRFLRSFGNFNDGKDPGSKEKLDLPSVASEPCVASGPSETALSTSSAPELADAALEDSPAEDLSTAAKVARSATDSGSGKMARKRSISLTSGSMAPLLRARSPLNCTVPMARVKPQFGVLPAELLANFPDEQVPAILVTCTSILRNSLREQGLFRIPGKMTSILEMKISFEQGKHELLEQETNMHNIAGLISQFFRELPEPLLTFRLYKAWVNAAGSSEKKRLSKLKKLTKKLPTANYNILKFFIRFLVDVAKNSGANRMSAQNLALVFGASLLNPQEMELADLTKIKLQCTAIELLICNYSLIFDDDEVIDAAPNRQQKSSSVATIPAGRPGTAPAGRRPISPLVPRSAPLARPVATPPTRRKARPASVRMSPLSRPHDDSSDAAINSDARQQAFIRKSQMVPSSQSLSSESVRNSMDDVIVQEGAASDAAVVEAEEKTLSQPE